MRVVVELDDLLPTTPVAGDGGSASPAGGSGSRRSGRARSGGGGTTAGTLRLERARTVASSLDLRGARVDEALEALGRYLDDAALAGLDQVTVIHGLGTGALRDAVRAAAADHPLVTAVRPGERGEGGDGASIIRL
jgi:DNA mismatch repair protein MutS2